MNLFLLLADVVNNFLTSTKSYFLFQDILHDLTLLQPLTTPPSLTPRPGFIRPLTPGLAASTMPTTSNSVVLSTVALPTYSTAAIFTSAGSSGAVLTSSATGHPQVGSITRPLRPSSIRPATTCSPSTQTLFNLKSLIKRRTSLAPPYASVARVTATYILPVGTSAAVDYLPLDLSVRSPPAVVPSGLLAAAQLPAPLGVEAQPEPSSSTAPYRIPILQRPRSTLAHLLTASPSSRTFRPATSIIEVTVPPQVCVEVNKDGNDTF
jgi:hypothetical protein